MRTNRVRASIPPQLLNQLMGMVPVAMLLLTVTCLLAGCGTSRVLADEPTTKVLVISDQLDGDLAAAVRGMLVAETNWLKDKAPVHATVIFVDGHSGELIGRLEATPGVARLRAQQLSRPFEKVMAFTKAESAETNRLNVPKVIRETLPSLNLPSQATVVFIGSPLYVATKEGDAFFNMTDAFIPGDGLLLEKWLSSIYSTDDIKLPANLRFHWLIPPSMANFQLLADPTKGQAAFESAPHQSQVMHFWAKYFGACQGTLVTAQSGAAVLAEQLRLNTTLSPLFKDVSIDPNGSHLMVKRVIIDGKEVERIERTRDGIKSQGTSQTQTKTQPQAEPQVKPEPKPQPKRDAFGNLIGKGLGLHGDRPVNSRVALLLLAQDEELAEALASPALAAIERRLLNQKLTIVRDVTSAAQLERVLAEHDQIWLWSGINGRLTPAMVETLVKRYRAGASLLLLADNEPHVAEARQVLQAIVPDADIRGNYEGKEVLSRKQGQLSMHDLTTDIDMLFEGDSTSHVVGDLTPVIRSSDNQVLLAEREAREGQGKLLVYCGFTAMYQRYYYPKSAGVDRLITNMLAYLASDITE